MKKHENELLSMFQKELKKEWGRVKSGEPAFIITKYTVLLLVLIGFVSFGYNVMHNNFETVKASKPLKMDAMQKPRSTP